MASAKEWVPLLEDFDGHVVGVAVLKKLWRPTALDYVAREASLQRNFWDVFVPGHRIMYCDGLDAMQFREPVPIFQLRTSGQRRGAAFTALTVTIVERCLASTTLNGQTIQQVFARWNAMLLQDHDLFEATLEKASRVCIRLFAPWAVCVASALWRVVCVSVGDGSRRSAAQSGLRLVPEIMPDFNDEDHSDETSIFDLGFNPSSLQSLIQLLQRNASALGQEGRAAEVHINWLSKVRLSLIKSSHGGGKRAYELLFLLQCVLLASNSSHSNSLKDLCLRAVDVCIESEPVRAYIKECLESDATCIPSRATLYRHRLTLHIGFCKYMSRINAAMIRSPGGMCCWQTVDSSPQMSYEWVLNGMVAMRASHLPDRFIDALKLLRREPGENIVGAC